MPALFPAMVLAPFYLVFTHDTNFEHQTIIPIYSSREDCEKQAIEVDNIMQNRISTGLTQYFNRQSPHAFCISTGWTMQATGGNTLGYTQFGQRSAGDSERPAE